MKYAIGQIDTTGSVGTLNHPAVKLPEATFLVGNPELLAKTGYPLLVLCQYDPADQFAYIVTMEAVKQALVVAGQVDGLRAACKAAQLALRATSKQDKDYSFELGLLNAAIESSKGD